jgi:GNAT superfamily N-acetyltransferase
MTGDRSPLTFRRAVPDDESFLFELYGSTRKEEMAAWGWDPEQEQMFLTLQFTAQRRNYDIAFPNAEHQIIMLDGRPIGRVLVERSEFEHRGVDIALLREHRNAGIGGELVQELLDEAARAGKPFRISVVKTNPALHLYKRLGFKTTDDTGTQFLMEWAPED